MEQQLTTHRCQAKSAKSHDVTSSDFISYENPCKRTDTINSPTQPTYTGETNQEKAQETYPWMKEFRSKGTKQIWTFCTLCPKDVLGTIRGRATPSLLVHISPALFPKSINELLEY